MFELILLAIESDDDRDYFAKILDRYQNALFIHINKSVQNEHDSWDCLQEAVLNVMEHFDRFMELSEQHQISYLFVACKNTAIKYFRNQKRKMQNEMSITDPDDGADFDILDPNEDVPKAYTTKENVKKIRTILKEMGEVYEIVAYYKFVVQCPDKEGAELAGISVENYRSRVFRIRRKLEMEIEL